MGRGHGGSRWTSPACVTPPGPGAGGRDRTRQLLPSPRSACVGPGPAVAPAPSKWSRVQGGLCSRTECRPRDPRASAPPGPAHRFSVAGQARPVARRLNASGEVFKPHTLTCMGVPAGHRSQTREPRPSRASAGPGCGNPTLFPRSSQAPWPQGLCDQCADVQFCLPAQKDRPRVPLGSIFSASPHSKLLEGSSKSNSQTPLAIAPGPGPRPGSTGAGHLHAAPPAARFSPTLPEPHCSAETQPLALSPRPPPRPS